jgi:hypothetical protein
MEQNEEAGVSASDMSGADLGALLLLIVALGAALEGTAAFLRWLFNRP